MFCPLLQPLTTHTYSVRLSGVDSSNVSWTRLVMPVDCWVTDLPSVLPHTLKQPLKSSDRLQSKAKSLPELSSTVATPSTGQLFLSPLTNSTCSMLTFPAHTRTHKRKQSICHSFRTAIAWFCTSCKGDATYIQYAVVPLDLRVQLSSRQVYTNFVTMMVDFIVVHTKGTCRVEGVCSTYI